VVPPISDLLYAVAPFDLSKTRGDLVGLVELTEATFWSSVNVIFAPHTIMRQLWIVFMLQFTVTAAFTVRSLILGVYAKVGTCVQCFDFDRTAPRASLHLEFHFYIIDHALPARCSATPRRGCARPWRRK